MAKPKRKPIEAATAPPERWQHDRLTEVPTDRAGVMAQCAASQDALDRYAGRNELSDNRAENARLYEAGKRLRDAWQRSGYEGVMTGGLEPGVDGWKDPDGRMVTALDKGREYRRLIQMVPTPCQPSCIMACCWGHSVGRGNLRLVRFGLAELARALRI